ncbi:hypothetical protein EYB25_005416 [Talaromyces marneffei]|uniref:Uncharacterized protein n=1 Tax=Talaromyces marneffei (strain ATCC 18224 / CBS 334.59 / QM 7333) TaxID=441960 RepID=B6QGY2_TALMQ|nr:uncharacterized protein EYB26_007290 [Talaromyces marneffei]EEA22638.1 conserved hypothetical protein [Talaromyces marneffei ATCC 18224]KAE8551526.1 hypothetical protein EYB25_005416 [Talaromyces marneffei]QGA19601.1 hypothetical protein EYB26_007290 [Talaromyces marneffei]
MSHSSIAPEAHEIVVLGALSQVPDLVNEVDDATTTSNFGVLQGAVDLFEAASGAILANAASSELFQGLSSIQPQPTVIGQVVGRAHDISKDFPPVWYVNFPANRDMTESQRESLQQHQQAIMDFKCWASLKWWANVFQILPTDDSPFNKLAQSGLFVTIAMMDLPQISWLRSTREPTRIEKGITCRFHELHDNIMNMAMETFHQLDEMSRNALEPVLQGIVLTASASTVDYKDLKMVLAEKYEYKSQTDSIVSSIRMICFTIGEAFYDVQEGKNSSSRWVQCEVCFVQYDAEFDLEGWRSHSITLNDETRRATEAFINQRTINI